MACVFTILTLGQHIFEDVLAKVGNRFMVGSFLHNLLTENIGLLILALADIVEKLQ